ncbi:MAG TPA: hypothetical protein VFY40_02440, partial [Blastocatellia bacterium]|nr:hypothetical protein [Blastocatellia bacterium]
EWLRGFDEPQFDEATLEGMRDSVLRDIACIENRTRRVQWVITAWPGWNLRFVFATSLALLLFGALFSLAINRWQSSHGPESNRAEMAPGKTTDGRATNDKQISIDKPVRRKFRRRPIRPTPEESPQTEAGKIEPDLITQNIAADPEIDQSTDPGPEVADPAPNRNMLRIEIQTADPNIRIIWFAPMSDTTPHK